jgi:hypothetical protein
MKNKLSKGIIGTIVNTLSDKNNKEVKNKARKQLLLGSSALTVGYFAKDFEKLPFADDINNGYLSAANFINTQTEGIPYVNDTITYLSTNGYTPMGLIQKGTELGITSEHVQTSLYLVGLYAAIALLNSNDDKPIQDELASYGSSLCPYDSFVVSENDFKAKSMQMKINGLYNLGFEFSNGSKKRNILFGIAKFAESAIEFASPKIKMVLDFIGKGEHGFELMSHRNKFFDNPRLINELPITNELKDIMGSSIMDLDNEKCMDEKKLVLDIRKIASTKSKEEIRERNVVLALVKVILAAKKRDFSSKDERIVKDLKELSKNTSTERIAKYVEVSLVAKHVFETIGTENFHIKDFDENLTDKENSYHILRELDMVCDKNLSCSRLKKPLSHREIYRNEIIFAIQNRMMGEFSQLALKNKVIQDNAPLKKEHFHLTEKIKSDLSDKKMELYEYLILKNTLNVSRKLVVKPDYYITKKELETLKSINEKFTKQFTKHQRELMNRLQVGSCSSLSEEDKVLLIQMRTGEIGKIAEEKANRLHKGSVVLAESLKESSKVDLKLSDKFKDCDGNECTLTWSMNNLFEDNNLKIDDILHSGNVIPNQPLSKSSTFGIKDFLSKTDQGILDEKTLNENKSKLKVISSVNKKTF